MELSSIGNFFSGLIQPLVTLFIGGGGAMLFYREMKREKTLKNDSSAVDVVNKAMDRLERENTALSDKCDKLRDELDDLRTEYAIKRCDKQKCITRIPPNNY